MKLLILLTLILSSLYSCTAYFSPSDPNSLRCSSNLDTPGTTFPRGDIIVPVGSNLTIYCMLNVSHDKSVHRNSSHLRFYKGSEPVPSEYISVLNETTIKLHMSHVKKSKSMFYCKLRDVNNTEWGVCLNEVLIDTKPQPITNFNCVSHNWQNLSCTWKNPHNNLKTKYRLKFRVGGPGASRKIYIPCPNETATHESCLWDRSTNPLYKQQDTEYFFHFHGHNQLGDWNPKEDIVFHHFQHVIPSPPINLVFLNKTSHSVTISWQPQTPMDVFPGGLVHKVEIQSMWDRNDVWKEVDTSIIPEKAASRYRLDINNLEYAFTHYDIRVHMKSGRAPSDKQFWSLPSNITFKTLPIIPDDPPKTDIGSFQIEKGNLGKRNVYIYWQQIPESKYNGPNFGYNVTLVKPESTTLKVSLKTNSYAKFENLEDMDYTFEIYSVNSKGKSSSSSKIRVPRKEEVLPEPISFIKIAYERRTYELSWIQPKMNALHQFSLKYYTLFWCANDQDRPFQCSGFLNWTHIPGDALSKNITVPDDKIYQFAISMNTDTASSGMVWSSCTVIHNNINSSRMKNVYIRDVGSSSIIVAWQLACSDRVGVIKGFAVSYCPLSYPTKECEQPEKTEEIHDPSVSEFNVTGLLSYKTYKLRVAVLTSTGFGEPSDAVLNTTKESAPSSPPWLKSVYHITNTSIQFTWIKPSKNERNGKIIKYQVCVNSSSSSEICIEEPDNESNDEEQNATLMNLDPNTNYSLKVRAFTTAWSANSSVMPFTTHIGNPGKIPLFDVKYLNATTVHIFWKSPIKPNGPLAGYHIKINYSDNKSDSIFKMCSANHDNCSEALVVLQCENDEPTVQIQAFNWMGETKLFGEWTDPRSLQCHSPLYPDLRSTIMIVFLLMLFTCLIPLIYYLGKKLLKTYEKSKKNVKLPPGLEEVDPKKINSYPSQQWLPEYKPPLPADEEYLIKPTRTPNRSESENESERTSLGSGDTHSSECHQTSSTSEGSVLAVNSTASTPPMTAHQAHNIKSNPEKSATALLNIINISDQPEIKPSEKNQSYVMLGTNPPTSPPVSLSCENKYSFHEIEEEDPSQLYSTKLHTEVKYPELGNYQKYGETFLSMLQPPGSQSGEELPVPPMKNLVISTSTGQCATTTICTSGYQTLPLSSSFNSSKPVEAKVSSPRLVTSSVSAIVIDKGINGYVTVSNASEELPTRV